MKTEYVYCAVNSKGEIQWVQGSSKRTRYYKTESYLTEAVEYHNHYYPADPWKVQKFMLVEVR